MASDVMAAIPSSISARVAVVLNLYPVAPASPVGFTEGHFNVEGFGTEGSGPGLGRRVVWSAPRGRPPISGSGATGNLPDLAGECASDGPSVNEYIDGGLAPNNLALVSLSWDLVSNSLELVSPSVGFVAVAKFPHMRGSEDFVGADVRGAAVGAGVRKAEVSVRGCGTGGESPRFSGVAAAAGAIPRNPEREGDGL